MIGTLIRAAQRVAAMQLAPIDWALGAAPDVYAAVETPGPPKPVEPPVRPAVCPTCDVEHEWPLLPGVTT